MFLDSEIMVARRFLEWARTASPVERAEGTGALARAFLYGGLAGPEREEARLVLTGLLDDTSPARSPRPCRKHFASAANAPHYMVLTLAGDHSEIAAIVLARSPLLSDAELVDFAATSDGFAQTAIALRPRSAGSGRRRARRNRRMRSLDSARRQSGRGTCWNFPSAG